MRYGRRRKAPLKLYAILAAIVVAGLTGAVFWYSGQAESGAPEPAEIRVEAVNVGAR